MLDRVRRVGRVDLDNAVIALLLALQDLQRIFIVARCDDAVGDLALDQAGGCRIARIRQGNEIAEGGHTVCASGTGIGTRKRCELAHIVDPVDLSLDRRKRQTDRGARRGNMLEGRRRRQSCRLLQLADKLPAVQTVEQIDIARAAVQYGDRQLAAVAHVNSRRFLIWIASIFKRKFFHFNTSYQTFLLTILET